MINVIRRVEIKGFLVFKGEFSVDFCPGINVFIGENGSGKTTLMKVLYRLCGSSKYTRTEEHFFSIGSSNGEFLKRPFEYIRMRTTTGDVENRICIKSLSTSGLSEDEGGGDHILINGDWVLYRSEEYEDDYTNSHTMINGIMQDELIFTSVNFRTLPSVFIPVYSMLSHSSGLLEMIDAYEVDFDATQVDVLRYAQRPATREITPNCDRIMDRLGEIIGGEVIHDKGRFYVKKKSGEKIEFSIEAYGFVRLGLLWKLLRNGLLESGSVLFWDEPDASVNPTLIPIVVNILLELSRHGVQIFLATHEYNLIKYFSIARKVNDQVAFYSLNKTDNGIACDREDDYDLLENNPIIRANTKLLEDDIKGVL